MALPVNPKPFGVDTAFPPNSPQVPPAPPGYPPFPPPGYPPVVPAQRVDRERRRNRWPLIVAAGLVGALVASTAAVAITLQSRGTTATAAPEPTAPVTVTVPAPTPAPPAPLPTAQADRQTCRDGYLGSDAPYKAATDTLAVLPPGTKILDPATQQNPEWADAVRKAGGLYIQAADILQSKIAPGSTPVLSEAATTAAKTYRVLGNSYKNFEPIVGNARDMAQEVSDEMAALCTRLAP